MHARSYAIVTGALLLAAHVAVVAQSTPAAVEQVFQARIALRYDAAGRCADVRPAAPDDAAVAVVVFRVGATGVPSSPSIKSSSGSEGLDTAASDCVLKLRFQPATRVGDGVAVDSWQQMAWRAVRTAAQPAPPAAASAAAAAAATVAPAPGSADVPAAAGRAEVRACLDAAGALRRDPVLTRSSGDAGLDAAAVQIVRAGATAYRPAKETAGCLEIGVKFPK